MTSDISLHCNILIPKKCPRKTLFKEQCPLQILDLPTPLLRITVCLCEPGIAVPLRPSSLDSSGMMHFIKKVVRASQP